MNSPSAPTVPRVQADRCPGLLRPHRAADGGLVRIRLPGGAVTAEALAALSRAAVEFGDGQVQLTSRGNVQLRGVSVDDDGEAPKALVDAITEAGLLPSATHELVRNITCSPRTGRAGGVADLRDTVAALDLMLCSTPALAALPGRFLFALDDGSGDVFPMASDLGLYAVEPERVALTVAGTRGPVVALHEAVQALRSLALGFLRDRGAGRTAAWHVRELPGSGAGLLHELTLVSSCDPGPTTAGSPPPHDLGFQPQRDGRVLLEIGVPLGVLTPGQVAVTVAAVSGRGSAPLVVTPWRSLLLPDLALADTGSQELRSALARVELSTDQASGWLGVSACAGAPGCASAAAPTRPIALHLAQQRHTTGARPVHVVACERRCGAPAVDHIEVLALPGSGHLVRRRPDGAGPPPRATGPLERPVALSALTTAVALARNAS